MDSERKTQVKFNYFSECESTLLLERNHCASGSMLIFQKVEKKMKKYIGVSLLIALIATATPTQAATTTLTTAQKNQLKYLVEEEKLARDVYTYLAANVTSQKFSNIVRSEQSHMDQVAALLKSYGVWNPTLTRPAGVFYNKDLQTLYNALTKEGSSSQVAAFAVGVKIEEIDIADLEKDLKDKQPADVIAMMNNLLRASRNHLAAFSR